MATALPHTSLLKHSQEAARSEATHYVEAEPDSAVSRLLGTRFAVNSFHHQAVAEPGPLLRVTARSADGIIEAIESTDFHPVMGVQWHPECFLPDGDACMLPLFRHFVGQAERYRAARQVHHRVLTLDSHCDTPMFFDRDIDLCRRDPQLLVDFVKMREGLLDASIMVAYLPQGELTPEAYRRRPRPRQTAPDFAARSACGTSSRRVHGCHSDRTLCPQASRAAQHYARH